MITKLVRPLMALSLVMGTAVAQNLPPAVPVATIATPAQVTSLVISRDGACLLATSLDGKLRTWSLPDGRLLSAVDIGQQGGRIHGVSDDGRLTLLTTPGVDRRGEVASVLESGNGKAQFAIHLKPHHVVSTISHDGK